ncbi:MAG: SEC-C domain-containing protein [Egibacteraceae bacterium]
MPIDQGVVEAAGRLLAAHHPISLADLAELLAKEGVCAPEGQDRLGWVGRHLSAVSSRSVTWELPDMRLVAVDPLYEGLVLTHKVMATELTTGVVELEPDLMPLELIEQLDDPEKDDVSVALAGGGRAELGHFHMPSDDLGLAGPPGWLGNAVMGGLLAFRVTNGELSVARVGEDPPLASEAAAEAVEALQSAYEQACHTGAEHEGAVQIVDVFAVALAENPGLFRQPLPPLRELFAAGGLEATGKWVSELVAPSAGELDEANDLSVAALQIVLEAYQLIVSGQFGAWEELGLTAAALAWMLSIRLVAPTFASQMIQAGHEPLVAGFAAALLNAGGGNAGPNLVLALCAELHGDTLAGEAYVGEALCVDRYHKDSLRHAAWYAEDRGDAAHALEYLRRAGVDDDPPQVRFLEHFAAPGPAVAALEEQCPCGSGRTHGHCCAQRNGYPLHERAEWLYHKAARYLIQPATQMAIRPIADARTQGDSRPLAWKRAALVDPLTKDLGLFEGGLLEEFLDVRGVLLPADELALGRSWVGIRRGLYEVASVERADRRLRLRDLATGRHLDVPEEAGVRYVPGLYLCARVIPDGASQRMLGAVLPLATDLGEGLLELLGRDPGAVEIAAWFAQQTPQ